MSLNKAQIIGRLGRDPEIKHTQNGDKIANLAVATSEKYTDKQGNRQENTEWHRVVFFGRQAEICEQYLSKGSQVYVEGKISTKKYVDQQGIERYATSINGVTLQMLGNDSSATQNKSNGYEQQSGSTQKVQPVQYKQQAQYQNIIPVDDLNDDIPF